MGGGGPVKKETHRRFQYKQIEGMQTFTAQTERSHPDSTQNTSDVCCLLMYVMVNTLKIFGAAQAAAVISYTIKV